MSADETMKPIGKASPLFKARATGLRWLVTILPSIFGMFVGGSLIISGDATATAANILAHEC